MHSDSKKVITRFPPSPTGYFHVGSVRTGLFNYIFSKQNKGSFILRIEDTDAERSKKEYEDNIIESLKWLGLEYENNSFTRQSDRKEVYKGYLKKLIDSGQAYVSKETPKEASDRAEVIRFKNPNKVVSFKDLIRGEVSMDTTDLKDFVIAKSLDEPLYHLAVVVDDMESGITHVIRGEDHISNTPRQILILEALGGTRPIYAHLPLILAEDRSKLSKRKHGEKVSLKFYIEQGFLKDALINYMALLGWNPGTEQELFSLDELVKTFDISRVQKSGAVFSDEKLRWFNKEYMRKMPEAELFAKIKEFITPSLEAKKFKIGDEDMGKLMPILLERSSTFGDIKAMIENGELDYYFAAPEYAADGLYWKGKKDTETKKALTRRLEYIIETLKGLDEKNFTKDAVKAAVWEYATAEGRGEVLWPVRFALSGRGKSPDPFVLAELVGKQVAIDRLIKALEKVTNE